MRAASVLVLHYIIGQERRGAGVANDCRLKVVSPEGAPITIAAKRRKWRGISNPGRRDEIICEIRHLGGGGSGIRTRSTVARIRSPSVRLPSFEPWRFLFRAEEVHWVAARPQYTACSSPPRLRRLPRSRPTRTASAPPPTTVVLHTWGRLYDSHPHIHGIVPGGGTGSMPRDGFDAVEDRVYRIFARMSRIR